MSRFIYSLKARIRWLPLALRDAASNRRWATAEKRFLVVRHSGRQPGFYGDFLQWVAATFPELRALFELRILPHRMPDGSRYLLHIPWLQDPLQHWSPKGYAQAAHLAADCDRHQIPIINRVDRLSNAAKSEGARRLSRMGIRTPQMAVIQDIDDFRRTLGGMEPPLLVRENYGHGGSICLIERPCDAAEVPLERFSHPVAVEFINTRDPNDGLYRRYRYLAAGDVGLSDGIHIARSWEVRGKYRLTNDATKQEELDFVTKPNPHHRELQLARKELGLDFVAFDYTYDCKGQMIVWEANPYPSIRWSTDPGRQYLLPATERDFAAMLALYLQRAGLEVPARLESILAGKELQARSAA